MNPKQTWFWVTLAAGLGAFIFLIERRQPEPSHLPQLLLPGFQATHVTSLQIQPAGHPLIRLQHTNDTWHITDPIRYRARPAVIEALVENLERLAPASLSPQELKNLPQADQDYGFSSPQLTLALDCVGRSTRILIGNQTAPGDQVFVQVIGDDRVFIVDAGFLRFIPRTVNEWRDLALADWRQLAFDRLLVTNSGKVLELQLDPTNRLWRMILPMESRADGGKVVSALRQLGSLQAGRFVSDNPKADLEAFGLQSPELSVSLLRGTNCLLSLDFGRSPTNDTSQIFARCQGRPSVVTVARSPLEPWRDSHESFRDRRLVTPTSPIDEIEVHARDRFKLQRQGGRWKVLPEGFEADTAWVTNLIGQLTGLEVVQFVKDVVTDQDLPAKGLAEPISRFIVKTAGTNASGLPTNTVLAQLDFGTNQDNLIYVRRAGESPVYAVKLADFQNLPDASWQLRDRQIWTFSENEVARIKIQQAGKVRELLRTGTGKWTFAPGSQGIMDEITASALDEACHRLGLLTAAAWAAGDTSKRDQFGFITRGHTITLTLTNGTERRLEMGGMAASGLPYASAAPEQAPWIFELSLGVYQFVLTYLTIPANIP